MSFLILRVIPGGIILLLMLLFFFATIDYPFHHSQGLMVNLSNASKGDPLPNSRIETRILNDLPKILFPTNLTVIDRNDFQFLINNDVCGFSTVNIVILIHSAIQNRKARDIIR